MIEFARTRSEIGLLEKFRPPLAWLAWLAFQLLRACSWVLHWASGVAWRAERKLGLVMYDRPCPHCGQSLWRGAEGCQCLFAAPAETNTKLPEDAEVDGRQVGGQRLHVRLRTRKETFHWARSHEFFCECLRDYLRNDDRDRRVERRSRR